MQSLEAIEPSNQLDVSVRGVQRGAEAAERPAAGPGPEAAEGGQARLPEEGGAGWGSGVPRALHDALSSVMQLCPGVRRFDGLLGWGAECVLEGLRGKRRRGTAGYRPTPACVLNPSPSVLLRIQEGGGGGGAVRAGVWLPQSIWASFCLSVSASARSPSDWQLTMSFTATQTGILPGRGRAVIKWPPRGTGCSTVIQLEPRCQAGPRPATKARLFHGPDSTAGRDGGALGNPSLGSAELSVWPSLNYVNTHFFKKCNNEAIA